MKASLGLLLVYCVINLGFIALGIGIGLLLHRMLPSVDLGTGILIGVVSAGFSIHYFIRMLWFSEILDPPQVEDEGALPKVWIVPPGGSGSGRRRKRKER